MSVPVKIGDLTFSHSTNNWRVGNTGNFISRRYLLDVKQKLDATTPRTMLASVNIPSDYAEAIESPQRKEWESAMKEELDSLIENTLIMLARSLVRLMRAFSVAVC